MVFRDMSCLYIFRNFLVLFSSYNYLVLSGHIPMGMWALVLKVVCMVWSKCGGVKWFRVNIVPGEPINNFSYFSSSSLIWKTCATNPGMFFITLLAIFCLRVRRKISQFLFVIAVFSYHSTTCNSSSLHLYINAMRLLFPPLSPVNECQADMASCCNLWKLLASFPWGLARSTL